jgi:hypothetical protein
MSDITAWATTSAGVGYWLMKTMPTDEKGNILPAGTPVYVLVHCKEDNLDYAILLYISSV